MKSSRYSPEQVAFGLRQAEDGTPVSRILTLILVLFSGARSNYTFSQVLLFCAEGMFLQLVPHHLRPPLSGIHFSDG